MFYWYQNDKLAGMFLDHIDDFIWGGTKRFEETVINQIRGKFEVGKQSDRAFKYLGVDIKQFETSYSGRHYKCKQMS